MITSLRLLRQGVCHFYGATWRQGFDDPEGHFRNFDAGRIKSAKKRRRDTESDFSDGDHTGREMGGVSLAVEKTQLLLLFGSFRSRSELSSLSNLSGF